MLLCVVFPVSSFLPAALQMWLFSINCFLSYVSDPLSETWLRSLVDFYFIFFGLTSLCLNYCLPSPFPFPSYLAFTQSWLLKNKHASSHLLRPSCLLPAVPLVQLLYMVPLIFSHHNMKAIFFIFHIYF